MGLEKNQVSSSTTEMDVGRNSGSQVEDKYPCQAVVKTQQCTGLYKLKKAQELVLVLSFVLVRPELDLMTLPCSSLDTEVQEKKWTSQKGTGKLSKNDQRSRKPGL